MRACEHPGCGYRGDPAGMVRTPNGEWFCPDHAPLFDQGGRPTRFGRRQPPGWRLSLQSPKGYDFLECFDTEDDLRRFIEHAIFVDAEDPAKEAHDAEREVDDQEPGVGRGPRPGDRRGRAGQGRSPNDPGRPTEDQPGAE